MARNEILIRVTGEENVTQMFSRIGDEADNSEKKVSKFGDQLQSAGAKASDMGNKLTLGVTLPLVGLGTVAVDAASDLEESMSKVGVVFGDTADEVIAFSETSAESLGIAKGEALEAAGTFGNLLTAMGLTTPEARDMSLAMVELAADMASFNNVSPEETLLALRSGLSGEAEPLKRFGVALRAAEVDARAMSMGLADANGELSEGAKIQARYAIIMEQTATAQGDFARTSDGLANSQRIAAAEFKDMLAVLGQELLPIAKEAVGVVTDLLGAFSDLPAPVKGIIVQLGMLAAAAGPALKAIGGLTSGIGKLANRGVASTAKLGLLAAGIAVLAVKTKEFGDTLVEVEKAQKGATNAADNLDNKVQSLVDSGMSLEDALAQVGQELEWSKKKFDENIVTGTALGEMFGADAAMAKVLGEGLSSMNTAVVNNTDSYAEYVDAITTHNLSVTDAAAIVPVLTEAQYENVMAIRSQFSAMEDNILAMAETAKEAEAAAEAERELEQAALDLALAQADELTPAAESADQAMLSYAKAVSEGTIVTDEHEVALKREYAALQEAEAWHEAAQASAERLAAAQRDAALAAQAHMVAQLDLAETLSDTTPQGLARAAIQDLKRQLDEGRITADEYETAVIDVQDAYGLVTAEGRALSEGVDALGEALARGIITEDEYIAKLQELQEDAKDGTVNVRELTGAFDGATTSAGDMALAVDEARDAIEGVTSQPWKIDVEWDIPPMPAMPSGPASAGGATAMQHGGSGIITGPALFAIEPGVKEAFWFSGALGAGGVGNAPNPVGGGPQIYGDVHITAESAEGRELINSLAGFV